MSRYFAVKRSVNNDYKEHESDRYTVREFEERKDAAVWLLKHYSNEICTFEISEGSPCWNSIYDFLTTSTNDDALFIWEWKRRGNFRSYKIIEFSVGEDFVFCARTKNLFKLKDGNVVKKK